jgi:hypothetical protein
MRRSIRRSAKGGIGLNCQKFKRSELAGGAFFAPREKWGF